VLERFVQAQFVVFARDLDAAEGPQMVGDELGVEQPVAAGFEPVDEVRHGDLAAVGLAVKHRFPEKRRADRDAIEPAHEVRAVPHLNRMHEAATEQFAIETADGGVDPGAVAIGAGGGAALDHGGEIGVDADRIGIVFQGLAKAARDVGGLQRDDAAQLRRHPEQILRARILGHGEDAGLVGAQDQLGGEIDRKRVGFA
jgi:hypothetical protein